MTNEIVITSDDSSATINLQGAHVTSWKIKGKEQLFMSPSAVFDGKSEVFGGIPIIFPRLGSWGEGKPFHGFARTSMWERIDEERFDGNVARLALRPDAVSRTYWDAEFVLTMDVEINLNTLCMSFFVVNIGHTPFEFTTLFHNYLYVEDLRRVSLTGLSGCKFKDAADGWIEKRDENACLIPQGPLDRVYVETGDNLTLNCPSGRRILLNKSLCDTVVWTPWESFTEGDFSLFLCVEPGNVVPRKTLAPEEEYEGKQMIRIESS